MQEKKTVTFRSALELMQLLSSAVTPEDELGMEHSAKIEQIV